MSIIWAMGSVVWWLGCGVEGGDSELGKERSLDGTELYVDASRESDGC